MLEVLKTLVSVAQKRPRDYRRLMRIRGSIFTTVAELDAQILTSPEPIPYQQLDRSGFRPIAAGAAWGRKYDCAWLHITGEVPDGVADPRVMLGIRGEGLIYSNSGDVVDSVSTVWIQGDLPHSGGSYRPITGLDLSAGHVDFYADVAFNGVLLYEIGKAVYHGARVVTRDDEAYGLYYDYLTLLVLAASTDERGPGPPPRGGPGGGRSPASSLATPQALGASSPSRWRSRRPATSRTRRSGTVTSTWRGCGRCGRRAASQPGRTSARSTPSTSTRTTSTARANRSSCGG